MAWPSEDLSTAVSITCHISPLKISGRCSSALYSPFVLFTSERKRVTGEGRVTGASNFAILALTLPYYLTHIYHICMDFSKPNTLLAMGRKQGSGSWSCTPQSPQYPGAISRFVIACHRKIAMARLGVGEVFVSSDPQTRPKKENELKIKLVMLLLQRWKIFLPAMWESSKCEEEILHKFLRLELISYFSSVI